MIIVDIEPLKAVETWIWTSEPWCTHHGRPFWPQQKFEHSNCFFPAVKHWGGLEALQGIPRSVHAATNFLTNKGDNRNKHCPPKPALAGQPLCARSMCSRAQRSTSCATRLQATAVTRARCPPFPGPQTPHAPSTFAERVR